MVLDKHIPPSESRNILVSLESRYGTCPVLSASEVMTRPRAERDLLMFPASLALVPSAPDLKCVCGERGGRE